jgi:hypothetical protein
MLQRLSQALHMVLKRQVVLLLLLLLLQAVQIYIVFKKQIKRTT